MCFSPADYAELLGLYLGDGHIARMGRTHRLRLFFDVRYATIVTDAQALIERCFPENRVGFARCVKGTTAILSLYCSHLPCLFPQDGAGKKHQRPIVLESWQRTLVDSASWAFLRGCIRSDGCVFVNRTGPYEYLSYAFRNRSSDICELFASACEQVGVYYRSTGEHVRINRRASVARMLEHVGVKS